MNYIGFSNNKNQYKGNLHTHTTNSDGKLTPDKVKALFKENGYSFLCLTDHDVYSDLRSELNDETFIILPGVEASSPLYTDATKTRYKKTHHVLGILGTSAMQKSAKKINYKHGELLEIPSNIGEWDGAKEAQCLVNNLVNRGMIVAYNHPIWSRVELQEFIHLKNVFALEFYNYGTVNECEQGYDPLHWDAMLSNQNNVFGIATDDSHNVSEYADVLGGYVVVMADALTHDNIIDSLIRGNYYSASGVDIIEWGIRDGVVYVSCEDVNKINFICGGCVGDGISIMKQNPSDELNYAEYTLHGTETYVRVECIDKDGKAAWTNPIILK